MSVWKKSVILILLVLIADQCLKVWIKTNMILGQEYNILGNWFIIHFTENNGMAFGMEFWGQKGKVLLSLFRIVASGGILWYMSYLIKHKAPTGVVLSIALIFAGAMGNIIDSAFYGMLFDESYYRVAEFLPESGGYSGFLKGRVVDMFYFPIIQGTYPDWFPVWANKEFIFFRPVFNLADSAITVGVFMILIFYRNYFKN